MIGDWKVFSRDPDGTVTYFLDNGDSWILKTETPIDNLIEDNKAELAESVGVRWGDGKVVARIPLNLFYDKLAEPMQQRDKKYISRFLNDGDNAVFRTFKGTV